MHTTVDIDHCGSAAILAAIQFRVWYKSKIGTPQLKNASNWLNTRIRAVHREPSEKIRTGRNNLKGIGQQKCPHCGKSFRFNKIKLVAHMKIHNN